MGRAIRPFNPPPFGYAYGPIQPRVAPISILPKSENWTRVDISSHSDARDSIVNVRTEWEQCQCQNSVSVSVSVSAVASEVTEITCGDVRGAWRAAE